MWLTDAVCHPRTTYETEVGTDEQEKRKSKIKPKMHCALKKIRQILIFLRKINAYILGKRLSMTRVGATINANWTTAKGATLKEAQ